MKERYEIKAGSIFSLVIAVITSFSRMARFDVRGYLFVPVSLLYTFCLSMICWMVLQYILRHRLPFARWNTMPVKCLLGIGVCAVLSLLYRPLNGSIVSQAVLIQELTYRQLQAILLFRGIAFSALQLLTIYFLDTLHAAEQSRLENEALKRDNLRAQLAVLQQQVSPHFLFNALNTIQTITTEEYIKHYTVQLAEVYRYLLQYRETNLVTVEQEMHFIQSYLYIQTTRFEDALKVEISISAEVQQQRIPPLAVQILIENALKHNIVSSLHPLSLRITNEDCSYLTVRNTYQPKSTIQETTKVGLQNVFDRYALLSSTVPVIQQTADQYMVKLPLLP